MKLVNQELYYNHEKNLILLTEPKKLSYFEELVKIRNFLEDNLINFPVNRCSETARIIKNLVGLEEIAGYYIIKTGLILSHSWNYDKKNNFYVDLTHDQFGKFDYKIGIFPLNTNRLKPDDEETYKQKNYVYHYLPLILNDLAKITQ